MTASPTVSARARLSKAEQEVRAAKEQQRAGSTPSDPAAAAAGLFGGGGEEEAALGTVAEEAEVVSALSTALASELHRGKQRRLALAEEAEEARLAAEAAQARRAELGLPVEATDDECAASEVRGACYACHYGRLTALRGDQGHDARSQSTAISLAVPAMPAVVADQLRPSSACSGVRGCGVHAHAYSCCLACTHVLCRPRSYKHTPAALTWQSLRDQCRALT